MMYKMPFSTVARVSYLFWQLSPSFNKLFTIGAARAFSPVGHLPQASLCQFILVHLGIQTR